MSNFGSLSALVPFTDFSEAEFARVADQVVKFCECSNGALSGAKLIQHNLHCTVWIFLIILFEIIWIIAFENQICLFGGAAVTTGSRNTPSFATLGVITFHH